MRISPIQSWTSRRDKNFWHSISCFKKRLRKISFNLRQRDEVKIHCFRSETLRRERQDKTIIARTLVNLICCLQLDWYFPKKRAVYFLICLEIMQLLSLGNLIANLIFETRTRIFSFNLVLRDEKKNFFFNSRVSRWDWEIENHLLWSSKKTSSWFSREFWLNSGWGNNRSRLKEDKGKAIVALKDLFNASKSGRSK